MRPSDGDPAPAGASVTGYPQMAVGAEGYALGVRFEADQGETVPGAGQRDSPALPGEHVQVRLGVPGEPPAGDGGHALRRLRRRRAAGIPAAALVGGLVGELGLRGRVGLVVHDVADQVEQAVGGHPERGERHVGLTLRARQ